MNTPGPAPKEHVDLVKNEWLAGYQIVVARAKLGSDGLEVEANAPAWETTLRRPFGDIDPDTQPEAFLHGLAGHIHGSYLFATEPHDEADCPYREMVVRMYSTGESQAHPQTAV